MSKHVRPRVPHRIDRPRPKPKLEDCLFHRCERHETVPMLNAEEEGTRSECGACIAEEMLAMKAQLVLVLDGYAERMIYSHTLRLQLAQARDRLNLLSPGAGDFIDDTMEEPW